MKKNKNYYKGYPITTLNKEDIESIGFDATSLKDKDMKRIAQMLGESYLNGNSRFWEELESILIEIYKLEQHDM